MLSAELVRPSIAEVIRQDHPEWSSEGAICLNDLHRYRAKFIEQVLSRGKGELTELETDVVRSMSEQELLAKNINNEFEQKLTLGERVADKVAEFGGSWRSMGSFGLVLIVWVVLNSVVFLWHPFDPYPFILLNLVLSCLAAIQAPVIMMSQNRQEAKDRLRGEHDYTVNLKAELEIRHLNAKMDLLLTRLWERLLEIQQVQTDFFDEFQKRNR
jgi:uncharacterized membrane protein